MLRVGLSENGLSIYAGNTDSEEKRGVINFLPVLVAMKFKLFLPDRTLIAHCI